MQLCSLNQTASNGGSSATDPKAVEGTWLADGGGNFGSGGTTLGTLGASGGNPCCGRKPGCGGKAAAAG